MATPTTPTDAQRRRARDLAQNGRQAAILGDSAAAFAQMREASQLDPTDADLAYQLARAYETAGAPGNAVKEYCRFLAIAPNAPEAGEARSRVAALAPPTFSTGPTVASTLFDAGVAAFDRKQFVRVAHLVRTKDECVEDCEDYGHQPEAKRYRGHNRQGNQGCPPERPQREPEVPYHTLEQHADERRRWLTKSSFGPGTSGEI